MNKNISRWIYIVFLTIIMVFFSEKMYWYIQGYEMLVVILAYLPGIYLFLYFIDTFKIKDFWPMVLAAVIYPLYVEGLFTGIIVSDITFLSMLSYFIGWHLCLSILIGWYFHQKWLINENYRKMVISSILLGCFWGIWSIGYWTERQITAPDFAEGFIVGQWHPIEFLMLAIYVTVLYIISQYIISRKSIQISSFKPGKIEKIIMGLIYIFLLVILFMNFSILALLLFLHLLVIFYPLKKYREKRNREETENGVKFDDESTIFNQLQGRISLKGLLILLLIPIFAFIVYYVFSVFRPSDTFIDEFIYDSIVLIQQIFGFIIYIVALVKTFKLS